jgi:hypothetical protein
VPYYSKLNSVGGVVSTIGSIVGGSISRLTSASAAENEDPAQYTMCEDPSIQANDIAAGPFCNIEYGIPPQYLNKDPEVVLGELADEIDQDTGEPLNKETAISSIDPTYNAAGSLKGWIDLCTDGTTAHAEACKITDEKTANYALYVIDHRIQMTMDGEDEELEQTATNVSEENSGNVNAAGWAYPTPADNTYNVCGLDCYEGHTGMDVEGYPSGSPVYAARDGVITTAGKLPNFGQTQCTALPQSTEGGVRFVGDGQYNVTMSSQVGGSEYVISYDYLQAGGIKVSAGDKVKAGDLIALSGTTGCTSTAHLHMTIKKNGAAIDPITIFGTVW